MAVLDHISSVHDDALGTMRYIQNPDKVVPGEQAAAVMRYMVSHSVERVMSVGYGGCCGVRDFDVEVFRDAEAAYKKIHKGYDTNEQTFTPERYLQSHKKKTYEKLKLKAAQADMSNEEYQALLISALPKRIKVSDDGLIHTTKEEVFAEHLTISVHKTDNPSPALLQSVMDEFMAHPDLQGFPALTNLHWDTPTHRHGHILISNYAADGSRKLCLSRSKRLKLQRHLDRICYKHGLSIIDSKGVRKDPAHAAWIDQVKAEGKITVWQAKEKGRKGWKAVDKQKKAETIERRSQRTKHLPPEQRELIDAKRNHIIENDLFIGDGRFVKATEITDFPPHTILGETAEDRRRKALEAASKRRIYAVSIRRYDPELHRYRHLSILELIFDLGYMAIKGETFFLQTNYPSKYDEFVADFGKPDYKLQAMMDEIAVAREYNCRTPAELAERYKDVGQIIGQTRRAIAYDEKTLSKTELVDAIRVWNDKTAPEEARKAAYATLAAYGVNSYQTREDLFRRVLRAEKRLSENREYMKKLNKDYRLLKSAGGRLHTMQYDIDYCHNYAQTMVKEHPHPELAALIAQKQTHTPNRQHKKEPTR